MGLFELRPLIALLNPGKQVRDLAHSCFADRISSGGRRGQVQQLHLDIWSQVDQAHDLADALPAQTAKASEVGVVFGVSVLDHVFEMNRQGEDLRNARQTPRALDSRVRANGPKARPALERKAYLKRLGVLHHGMPSFTNPVG